MGFVFFFQAEDGIRDGTVTGVQTCALPISGAAHAARACARRAWAAAAALACRDPVPDGACAACAAAASAAAIIAAYFAAITELWMSSGQIARHTVSRRPGRPRREMCAWPSKAPA